MIEDSPTSKLNLDVSDLFYDLKRNIFIVVDQYEGLFLVEMPKEGQLEA